jgi:hypothetical protein
MTLERLNLGALIAMMLASAIMTSSTSSSRCL